MGSTNTSQVDHDLQETADMLRSSEERVLQEGIAKMKALHQRYKQAQQSGNTALAKKLRRDYYQELFMNVITAASPMELLFPDPKAAAMMDDITQELGW
jgi:hypothetical protein